MLQAQAHKWAEILLGKTANTEKLIQEKITALNFTHYAQKLDVEEQEDKKLFLQGD